MGDTVLITGNTFPVKDSLKAMGGKWDAVNKGWRVPAAKAEEAQKLVAPAPTQKTGLSSLPRYRRAAWRPCGYPGCSPTYCDECDGKGSRGGY